MNSVALAFKDWKTTLPGLMLAVFSVLSAFSIVVVPDGVQQALLVVVLFIVGLVDGGVGDLKTTVPAFIIALCGVVVYFTGWLIPGDVVMGLTTLAVTVIGLLSGGLGDLKTSVPSAVLGFFGVLGFILAYFGVTIPANLPQAVATIAVVVLAFLTGQPVPLPEPVKRAEG